MIVLGSDGWPVELIKGRHIQNFIRMVIHGNITMTWRKWKKKDRRSILVRIDNLTPAQELALCDYFAQWVRLGQVGSSRWTSFYADGDGNFRPKITVNGEKPEFFGTHEQVCARWKGDEYRLDFDEIAIQTVLNLKPRTK